MGFKHPIRDLLFFWVGERMWKRHEAKKNLKRGSSSQPYQQSKFQDTTRR